MLANSPGQPCHRTGQFSLTPGSARLRRVDTYEKFVMGFHSIMNIQSQFYALTQIDLPVKSILCIQSYIKENQV